MNIFNLIRSKLIVELQNLYPHLKLQNLENVTVELPKEHSHGDLATNAAMVLSKELATTPRDLAEKILSKISNYEEIESCSIAGPGFINIILDKKIWSRLLSEILSLGNDFGRNNIGKNHKINIEFVSVNPTGPMHVGHARGAVFGDVLAEVLKYSGYDVIKEYYVNDAGAQIDVLAKSAYIRYLEASGQKITDIPSGLYPGDYLVPVGKYLYSEFKDKLKALEENSRIAIIKPIVVEAMLTLIKNDLSLIGVSHDIFFSEKSLHDKGAIEKAVKVLQNADLIYRGKLDPPKGKIPEDWEDREQLLFKSTKFSDDVDRPLQKSNGEWTYFAADLAYAEDKIERGFNNITMILGADHGGYVKRIKASISALSDNKVNCNIQIMQLVNYYKNGLPFKMSKRSGNFITLEDVVEAVGKDVIRFIMLTRKNDIVMDFDLEKVTEQSKDNPVFYVQYAHARSKSILTNSKEVFPDILDIIKENKYNLSLLDTNEDIKVIKTLGLWPRIVEQATIHQEPHRIAYYLNDLASVFHSYWSMGRENKNLRFIIPENKNLSVARVCMVIALTNVIANGLNIFNIAPIDEM